MESHKKQRPSVKRSDKITSKLTLHYSDCDQDLVLLPFMAAAVLFLSPFTSFSCYLQFRKQCDMIKVAFVHL
jgi:hypothetical protein